MFRLRRRISSAHVIALVALFVSLGGTSFAALTITGKNIKNGTVSGADVKNSSLTGKDVKNNSLSGADINNIKGGDVKNGSLTNNDILDGALTGAKIADGSLNTSDLADNAVTSPKVADNSLTGNDVNESTLGQVPDSALLAGRLPATFLSSTIYKKENPVSAGTRLGDNTNVNSITCDPGDILLSGGPANVNAASKLLESFPSPGTTNGWSARINDNGAADTFNVVILCVNQTP